MKKVTLLTMVSRLSSEKVTLSTMVSRLSSEKSDIVNIGVKVG